MHVGMVYWDKDDGIASAIADTITSLGYTVTGFLHNAALPDGLDLVLMSGPNGSIMPLAQRLLEIPPSRRPVFAFWMTEQLWNPALPTWFGHWTGEIRAWCERISYSPGIGHYPLLRPGLAWINHRAYRYRYYGDLLWLKRQGLLQVFAIPSKWTAGFLAARGFDVTLAFIGSYPGWGADLRLERDIQVLWLGKAGSARRRGLLAKLRQELRQYNIEMLVVDGVENPYCFGEERTRLLNRTKIVLNLARQPWDSNTMRYYITAPNRALIVTEPTLRHTPFLPGEHIVEVPTGQLAATIRYYLDHEAERQQIAERAYDLVTTTLTMQRSVEQILEEAKRRWGLN